MTRKFTSLFLVVLMICSTTPAFAQGIRDARVQQRFNLRGASVNARDYAGWQFQLAASVAVGSSAALAVPSGTVNTPGANQACFYAIGNNRNIQILQAGQRVLVIDGTSTETVTLTAVSLNTANQQCTITATFANAHNAGAILQSGAFGLDEAILDLSQTAAGGTVAVDADWQGTDALLAATNPIALGTGNVVVIDGRGTQEFRFWGVRNTSNTLISAPAAPTVAVSAGGSFTTGNVLVSVTYVDALGGESVASTETTAAAVTTTGGTLTVSAPAASTGAIGYRVYMTAVGGSTLTGVLHMPTTACTFITTENVIPACSLSSSAVVAAPITATAKIPGQGTAHTTFALQPFTSPPLPFQSVFGPFTATATLSNSNADGAELNLPAGFFNTLGKSWNVCVKGATATAVASSILVLKLNIAAAYGQSPVALSTITFATQTRAAAGTFQGCWQITTNATGASGTFWARDKGNFVQFLNSAPATQVISADASAAASSAVNLTGATTLSVNLAETAGNNLTGPIINMFSIEPVPNN